jgi:hypothetical protein
VDQRLDLLNGQQVANLTADDAPYVAKALTAVLRGKAIASTVEVNNIPMVRLYGVGIQVHIRGEDWLKLAPYFVDGTLNPLTVAFAVPNGDPPLDVSTIDLQDPDLYNRILGLLLNLFPTKFPRYSY